MRDTTPSTFYPIFRLTLPLAAGIFLAKTVEQGRFSEFHWLLAMVMGWIAMLVVTRWCNYTFRWLYGVGVVCFMGCLGGWLVQHQRKGIVYDWPSEQIVYQGVITDTPQEKPKTYLCKVQVDAGLFEEGVRSVGRIVRLYVSKDSLSERLQRGDRLRFYAHVSQPEQIQLPGTFDYVTYLFRQRISGTAVVFPGQWQVFGSRTPLGFKQQALARRERVLDCYRHWGFSNDEFAVLSALTVGYKDELSEELQDTYRVVGASHILALSGMHVAVLWGLFGWLTRPLARRQWLKWVRCGALVGTLWGFAFLTGLSASVVRAVVMCMLVTVAQAASTRAYSLNALGVTAFFMLLYNPFYLFDVGFQLSFLAVFSILIVYPFIFQCIAVKQPVLRYVWGVVAVSLAAQLGTFPLVLYYYSYFPVLFLLANLFVTPLSCLVIYGAVVMFALSPLAIVHGWAVNGLGRLLRFMNSGVQWMESLPWTHFGSVRVSALQMCVLYLFLVGCFIYCTQRSRKSLLVVLLIANLFLGLMLAQKIFYREQPQLFFTRSQVKAYPQVDIWQQNGIYRYKKTTVCVVADDRWQNKVADDLLILNYIYLCRGYQGEIAPLQNLFRIEKVVLDASLGTYRLERLKEECRQLGLDYVDTSSTGFFRVFL